MIPTSQDYGAEQIKIIKGLGIPTGTKRICELLLLVLLLSQDLTMQEGDSWTQFPFFKMRTFASFILLDVFYHDNVFLYYLVNCLK